MVDGKLKQMQTDVQASVCIFFLTERRAETSRGKARLRRTLGAVASSLRADDGTKGTVVTRSPSCHSVRMTRRAVFIATRRMGDVPRAEGDGRWIDRPRHAANRSTCMSHLGRHASGQALERNSIIDFIVRARQSPVKRKLSSVGWSLSIRNQGGSSPVSS